MVVLGAFFMRAVWQWYGVWERASGKVFGFVASCNREISLEGKLQGDFPITEANATLCTRPLCLPLELWARMHT